MEIKRGGGGREGGERGGCLEWGEGGCMCEGSR